MTLVNSALTKSFKGMTTLTILVALLAVSNANLFDEELRGYLDYEQQKEAEQNQFEDNVS